MAAETMLDAERLRYGEYFNWYRGKLESLYSRVADSQVNGLALIPASEMTTKFNYFGAASRFYIDAMLGDVPESVLPHYGLLERIARHWAVTGEYCIVKRGRELRAVRPDFVFPIKHTDDDENIIGFVFVFPEQTTYGTPTGKARVIEYDTATGAAFSSIRDYAVGTLGNLRESVATVRIDNVLWVDTHDGIYDDVQGIVRELNIRMAFIQSALNSTTLSLLQANPDRISGFYSRREITPANVGKAGRGGLGMLVEPPFMGEGETRYIERTGSGLNESLEYMRLLLGQLAVMSGVPDYIYGVSLNQSPSEIERILFAGQARINRLRRAVERTFGELGIPVAFTSEPFTTKRTRVDTALKAFQAGVISVDETRAALGYLT